MLRDVPHCKSILKCGAGALVLCVVVLTWVYPLYCSRVSQVKETKVREFVEDRYGIAGHSVDPPASQPDLSREISKAVDEGQAVHATMTPSTARRLERDDVGDRAAPDGSTYTQVRLPAGKMP